MKVAEFQTGNRKKDVMRFLQWFIAENHYPPSYRQIGAHVGLSSTSSVRNQLQNLQQEGLIHMHKNIPRALRITETGHEFIKAG